MSMPVDPSRIRRFRRLSRGAGMVTIIIGCMVILGRIFEIPILKSGIPGLAAMKANSAVAFILGGISLWLLAEKDDASVGGNACGSAIACSTVVAVLGGLSLIEYLTGWNYGLGQILFQDHDADLGVPGRIALMAALGILFTGLGMALIGSGRSLKAAQQMGRQIDDLLAFSRPSRQPLSKKSVSTRDLVSQVLEKLSREHEGRDIDIVVVDLPDALADQALLKLVFANLISNAIKFTRRKDAARIDIGSRPEGRSTVYFIRDNGVGFDMQYCHKLFGVFQRLHRAEDYEGTGVGLANVQRIIHRHGGRVRAEAEPDRGAAFYFTTEGGV